MNQLAQRRDRYLELTNHILSQLAHQRQFPVCNNHCFQRIVLDNLFGQCWYTVLQRGKEAAYKQLTEAQLESAIALAEAIIAEPDEYIYELNQNSLRWRKSMFVNKSKEPIYRNRSKTVAKSLAFNR